MDTKQLNTFRHLAKSLNFSKTAEELNFAQSTVSAQIRSLENELRLTLFDRLGKKVILTNEGHSVLNYANRFMTIEDEFISSLKKEGEITGELNIFAPNTVCVYHLPLLLTNFKANHKKVNFKLRAHYDTKRALTELKSGNIDLMIVLEEEFQHADFHVDCLRNEEIIMVCNNQHPFSQRGRVSLTELRDQNLILTEPSCGYRNVLSRTLLKLGHKLDPNMWFENIEAIKQCVISNMGLSFLPKIATQSDINCGAFSQVRLEQKFDTQIKLQLITHKDKWLNPALKEFIKELKARFDE